MSTEEKKTVYVISCPETELDNLHTSLLDQVGQAIVGDIGNNPEGTEFTYIIKVKQMTDKRYNSLPEYES